MGVRGLTSYIARRAELYLEPYELHDCNLVIDGDNLACNLYRDASGTYSAFGGDYDDFYRFVVQFFSSLAECKIKAFVLMDGGYQRRKLRTVRRRLLGKIAVIKRINPCGSATIFPLMIKEVFLDAVRDCRVPVMRCTFEADDELAALARKLNCPVLSYDSDFYVHNVSYIPLITLTLKVNVAFYEGSNTLIKQTGSRVRQNNKRNGNKKPKCGKQIQKNSTGEDCKDCKMKTFKYLDCCIYRMEKLLRHFQLSRNKMPVLAAMLGNDYISCSAFTKFFQSSMGSIGLSHKTKKNQNRIKRTILWLRNETAETAVEKILSRLPLGKRSSIRARITDAISGYRNEKCESFDFFQQHYPTVFANINVKEKSLDEKDTNGEEVSEDELQSISSNENESEDKVTDAEEENASSNCNESVLTADSADSDSSEANKENEIDYNKTNNRLHIFPAWFLNKLHSAQVPRYFVDLFYLHKYINNPQIEHFPYKDCNEIALPILIYIYTLLHHAKPQSTENSCAGKIKPLAYLTRTTKFASIRSIHYALQSPPKYDFVPEQPNSLSFREIFEYRMPHLSIELLFNKICELPEDLHLYFLGVVYWLTNSEYCNLIHLHSLIICVIVLRTIDSKISPERDAASFQRRFGKIIAKEKAIRFEQTKNNITRCIKKSLETLSIPERMPFIPKSDCYLVQNDILTHFHMQEIFKKKFDLYSSTVLHAYAEFQAVIFHMYGLNALLNCPYMQPHMGHLYCGVFLYNMYDLLKGREDVVYYVKHYIFRESQMMYDFYQYLWQWCDLFVPKSKKASFKNAQPTVS